MRTAERELLAPREDVWAFLAEPYHLPDWWPGLLGVEPDRRGFAPGARWKARVRTRNLFTGRGERETLVLVRAVEPYERFAWHLLSARLDVELRLRAAGPRRTLATCTTSGRRRVGAEALRRLYDLLQTAAGP
ncbi:MAG TPA: SRPBCC family protein [Gaiellaceae bacterium]|nr:SRPBCC family protein [Gaiellaceae bacterium]